MQGRSGRDQEGTRTPGVATEGLPLPVALSVSRANRLLERRHLAKGSYRVGASSEADVVLDDEAVSRQHIEVTLVPRGVHVRDLQSKNGTFYLGQRIQDMVLSFGGRITLGATELLFEVDSSELLLAEPSRASEYDGLRGDSAAMRRLFATLTRLEGSLVNVLIQGEPGTGKELIARALQRNSSLREAPFVAVDCGSLDRSLLRGDLFGREGAAGAVAEADGGTLFLDEVAELPRDVQPLLLRVLESGTYSRVGDSQKRQASLRVIAATDRRLREEVEGGRFRLDLFQRLAGVELVVPALRERPTDIVILARQLAESMGLGELPPPILAELGLRHFAGNVRELKHALLGYGATGVLPPERPAAGDDTVVRLTRDYLEAILRETTGDASEAARRSGLSRDALRGLLLQYGLEPKAR